MLEPLHSEPIKLLCSWSLDCSGTTRF